MLEQGSEEWFAIRRGKVTASRIADLMAETKRGGVAASRKNYAAELVAERLTGTTAKFYVNEAMQWGTDQEAPARDLYAFLTDASVTETGFVVHPSIPDSGASPDGLVGDDGLVEIKCPNTATHIETLLGGGIADKYRKQMLWQMACTGRQFCDFVSYDPRLPGEMQMHIERVERNDEEIGFIEGAVRKFLAEIAETEARLRAKFMAEAA